MSFAPADHARIAAAIAAAEARTSGEVFCIVSTRARTFPETALAWAALAALTLPVAAVLAGFAPWAWADPWAAGPPSPAAVVEWFVASQAVVFMGVAALLGLTGLARALTPRAWATRGLHRLAREQFLAKGLHETAGRTGVLIFASLPDHYAEVVADEGIYARVPPERWADAVASLIAGARAGDVAGGFERAVELVGAVLAEHFPPGALNPNEIADRLVEI